MLLCFFLFGAVLSAPSDDVQAFINEAGMDSIGEITMDDETFLMHIVPSGIMKKKFQKAYNTQLSDIFGHSNMLYKNFVSHMEKGHTKKGLTFNIYDVNIREATFALYRLIRKVDPEDFKTIKEWAKQNINSYIFDYAERLCTLYGPNTYNFKWKAQEPPFLVKPNFYVNGETIIKALKLKSDTDDSNYLEDKINQFYKAGDLIVINTNYSGWNEPQQGCEDKIDYFTEDISLNAYYFGLHLLHPFWISNNEMDEINPRHPEHYYFKHQQLWSRYQLEKLSLKQRSGSNIEHCDDVYKSYLIYDNGLPFPIRSNILGDWNDDRAKLKAIDIGIREFISRGFFIMDNGTKLVNLTADNYISLIAKIIRANYDEPKTANIIRSLGGYGRNGHKIGYNPAPSLMHQPETALRDPAYWYMIKLVLNYFSDFQDTLEPLDISEHETNDIIITGAKFPKLSTFFNNFHFIIDKDKKSFKNVFYAARQRRLNHSPITFNFTVISKREQDASVRLFLGPRCFNENCWESYYQFYQLDAWSITLKSGENSIWWSPEISQRLSTDEVFNKLNKSSDDIDDYNMFKFPQNLILPKGLEDGLDMTLFIIMTQQSESASVNGKNTYYDEICQEPDEKPLGFPFHRKAYNYKTFANNYKFYNITIFHNKQPVDSSGYFSPHLY